MTSSDSTAPLRPGLALVLLLAVLASLGQFATSIYTPSIPDLTRTFTTSMALVQLTLTVFLAAFATSQLFFGPLADRYGRRVVLFGGIVLFIAGSIGCALATSIDALLGWRVLQAVGAGASTVSGRAVVRDCFDGAELARVMAVISIAFAVVPGLTPLLGGFLHDTFGWSATFWTSALLAVAALAAALAVLPETNRQPTASLAFGNALAGYAQVLRSPSFVSYAGAGACTLGGIFAFLAGSPAVFIDRLGVSATGYGLYPPIAISGFIVGGLFARRAAGRIAAARLAALSLAILSLGAGAMLAFALADWFTILTINLSVITFSTGMGILMPVCMAESLRPFPERAGTAAAMAGFLQMSGAALGTILVGLYDVPLGQAAFPAAMVTMMLMALAAFALPARARRREALPTTVG